jgi:hypothetical protein
MVGGYDEREEEGMNNDGGLAFPVENIRSENTRTGMSLRDWFAGQATDADINGFIASKSWGQVSRSEARYMFADAMLAERAKGEK